MPAPSPDCYLNDGPLMASSDRRARVLQAMAEDLSRHGVPHDAGDTRRLLRSLGYNALDVSLLTDEARAIVFQGIVAREMSGT